jgi:hypothetical protein
MWAAVKATYHSRSLTSENVLVKKFLSIQILDQTSLFSGSNYIKEMYKLQSLLEVLVFVGLTRKQEKAARLIRENKLALTFMLIYQLWYYLLNTIIENFFYWIGSKSFRVILTLIRTCKRGWHQYWTNNKRLKLFLCHSKVLKVFVASFYS